jgi:hypothetical protein
MVEETADVILPIAPGSPLPAEVRSQSRLSFGPALDRKNVKGMWTLEVDNLFDRG